MQIQKPEKQTAKPAGRNHATAVAMLVEGYSMWLRAGQPKGISERIERKNEVRAAGGVLQKIEHRYDGRSEEIIGELLNMCEIWQEDMTGVAALAGRSVLLLRQKDAATPIAFLGMLVKQGLSPERLETLMRYGLGFGNVVNGIKKGQGGHRAIYYQRNLPPDLWDVITDSSWRGHE